MAEQPVSGDADRGHRTRADSRTFTQPERSGQPAAYGILDGILALYLDKQKSEAEIVAAGYEAETVRWVVKRYHTQAFKRKQLAPEIAI